MCVSNHIQTTIVKPTELSLPLSLYSISIPNSISIEIVYQLWYSPMKPHEPPVSPVNPALPPEDSKVPRYHSQTQRLNPNSLGGLE